MKATKAIRIWARLDPEFYERVRKVAERLYEGNESMVVRAALAAYVAEREQGDETEAAA